jgi:hypothetical protein
MIVPSAKSDHPFDDHLDVLICCCPLVTRAERAPWAALVADDRPAANSASNRERPLPPARDNQEAAAPGRGREPVGDVAFQGGDREVAFGGDVAYMP